MAGAILISHLLVIPPLLLGVAVELLNLEVLLQPPVVAEAV